MVMARRKMLKYSLKILLLFFGISHGSFLTNDFNKINSHEHFGNKLREFLSKKSNTVSLACKAHILEYSRGLLAMEGWALKMFDANAKFPSGIFEGNLVELGSFDECLKIEKTTTTNSILGKYCLGTVSFNIPNLSVKQPKWNFEVIFGNGKPRAETEDSGTGIQMATCLPHACSASDIQEIYRAVGLYITVSEEFCQTKNTQPQLNTGGMIALSFFGTILWILVASTVYDIILFYFQKRPIHPVLIAFSVLKNGKKLLAISNSPNQIACLHGIRVISTMWIILGHRYYIQGSYPAKNLFYLAEWMNDRANMFIMGATVSVDTFFLMAGVVISYMFMREKRNFNGISVILFYVHRYIRLTPALAVVILIHITLLQHLGSGPLWPTTINPALIESCENNWWKALLYIQNYGNLNVCIPQTWYLSVDTQLFFLSPILLIPLKIKPMVTLLATGFLTICSILSCFLTAWFFELNGSLMGNNGPGQRGNYMRYYYMATWTRAAPWLMGIVLGYFIFKIKKRRTEIILNKLIVLCLWAVSLAVLCTCVFTGHNLGSGEYNKLANSFFIALVRPAWSVALGWVIFACVTGYGGPINWFLSLPVFQVVSKFTYSLYLVHYTVIYSATAQMRTPPIISNPNLMYKFWGDFAFTLVIAVILTLTFESPIITIEKCIFGQTERKEPKEPRNVENGTKVNEIA